MPSGIDIVMAIVALCVVIVLHEFGHYITAVRAGMKVDRFSVFGIGPAIFKLGTWRGTEFVISAIPFGAYVLIRGMEPEEDSGALDRPLDPDSPNFRDKPLGARALTIAGGPIANYITAIGLFFLVFAVFGPKQPPDAILIDDFQEVSPARDAGLEQGDQLLVVGETPIDPTKRGGDLSPAAEPYRGEAMPVTVLRDGKAVSAKVQVPEEGYALGIHPRPRQVRKRVDLGEAAKDAFAAPFITTATQLEGLYMLATGQLKGDVSGPVRIVGEIAKSARRGFADFIEITALISTLLGMFNLLPLPALDGGRLCFLGYEAIMRRKASPRVEELVHGYGMLALLGLILLVTVADVKSFF
jgi:regulator of sigma E protease